MGNRIRIKQIDLQGIFSASNQVDILSASNYASFVTQLDTTMSSDAELSAVSSSISQSIYTINQVIGSGLVSGSSQLTSSYDSRYILSGSIPNIPTGSFATTGSNTFNGDMTLISSSNIILRAPGADGPNGAGDIVWQNANGGELARLWNASDSNRLNVSFTGSHNSYVFGTLIHSLNLKEFGDEHFILTSSFNQFTESIDGRVSNLESATGSYLTSLDGTITSSQQITDFGFISESAEIPLGTISGSSQLTSSFDTRYTLSGSVQPLPNGLISGSSQLTSSYDTRYVISGSVGATPLGTISGSAQITAFGFISSSSAPAGTISGSSQLTSSYDSRYSLSGSVLTSFSSSVDSRLDMLEASIITGSVNYIQTLGARVTGVTSTGVTIITGSITTTGNPIQIMVTGDANPIGGTSYTRLQIYRDDNAIGNIVQVENSANLNVPYCLNVIDTPSAGTYTYSMRTVSIHAGTLDFGEHTGPTLTAVELNSQTSFEGKTLISGSSQLTSSFDSRYTLSGSNLYVQNDGIVEITGSLRVSGSTILNVPVLYVGTGSGFEGGEIDLAYAQSGSTTLTGSAIVFDVYGDKIRIFENGGTNRGGYFDISTLDAGVGTDLGKVTYLLEAYANVSYTLPGSYTDDVCRYSVVSLNLNVPTYWFNTSTYTFTPLKAGYWEILASYDVYRNGEASLLIKKNGTTVASAGAISSVAQQITKIIYLNGSTDYINVYNTGVQANARTQISSNAFFQARFVGA